ncbi:MAG: YggS family pyridoxal phosphate-dependent enzyme [Acidimicrobiia bacterium]|nr:YggS family pyridoxal phosphate-dependent enzyme [Acidimicrobiia bacterium]
MAPLGITRVRNRMEEACARAGVDPSDVTLVVVSKGRSTEEVMAVYRSGERVFGENREQGLRNRIDADLPDDISWHFVGHLQGRKVPYVAQHVDLLESMDRLSLAERWVQRTDTPVLAQFNVGSEPQKSGFAPHDADHVLGDLLDRGVNVIGVMAIPPLGEVPEDSRRWFSDVRSIYDRWREQHAEIRVCSMGMTNDFEVAIEEGATMVRIGRAIFASDD